MHIAFVLGIHCLLVCRLSLSSGCGCLCQVCHGKWGPLARIENGMAVGGDVCWNGCCRWMELEMRMVSQSMLVMSFMPLTVIR